MKILLGQRLIPPDLGIKSQHAYRHPIKALQNPIQLTQKLRDLIHTAPTRIDPDRNVERLALVAGQIKPSVDVASVGSAPVVPALRCFLEES